MRWSSVFYDSKGAQSQDTNQVKLDTLLHGTLEPPHAWCRCHVCLQCCQYIACMSSDSMIIPMNAYVIIWFFYSTWNSLIASLFDIDRRASNTIFGLRDLGFESTCASTDATKRTFYDWLGWSERPQFGPRPGASKHCLRISSVWPRLQCSVHVACGGRVPQGESKSLQWRSSSPNLEEHPINDLARLWRGKARLLCLASHLEVTLQHDFDWFKADRGSLCSMSHLGFVIEMHACRFIMLGLLAIVELLNSKLWHASHHWHSCWLCCLNQE